MSVKNRVLILGGQGRIGAAVASDLVNHTQARVVITGRTEKTGPALANQMGPRVSFLALDLEDRSRLETAIADTDLVVHCTGPFHHRDGTVLKTCIERRVDYLDVSDYRDYTIAALALREQAEAAGVTAIVNSGIFPGISNSMVRQAAEHLDRPQAIHLSYIVQGSGGAGVTVMRTTFLGLKRPFKAWLGGEWQEVKPYTGHETVQFPQGPGSVYWFDMPESYTLSRTFPVHTVVTKFGVDPDFYNQLTWMAAHWLPDAWMRNPNAIEFLSQVSHQMTSITDSFSGIGVRIRAQVSGLKDGQPARRTALLTHENTTAACGIGTGSLAELMLTGEVHKPGVWTVDEALPTPLFEKAMAGRGIKILFE